MLSYPLRFGACFEKSKGFLFRVLLWAQIGILPFCAGSGHTGAGRYGAARVRRTYDKGKGDIMRIWGLKTCDTCRKALKALQGAGATFDYVDVRADGVDRADLVRFHAAFGDALVNKRSTTWRGLSEAEHAGDPIDLLAKHPTLMKRPVIEDGDELTLGWDAKTRDGWLERAK